MRPNKENNEHIFSLNTANTLFYKQDWLGPNLQPIAGKWLLCQQELFYDVRSFKILNNQTQEVES